jgi:O-antigen/teichoic acid export membrane protein
MDKRAIWLYIARFILALSGLAVHFFFARIGGVSGYGTLSLFLSLMLIFNNLTDFGISLNGPRYLALNDQPDWAQSAVHARRLFGLLSSLLYLVVAWIFYKDQFLLLLAGLPLIAGFSLQADWIYRGKGRPDRAAFRQMIQSLGQLLVVALVWVLKADIIWALGAYAAMGLFSFLYGNLKWGGANLVKYSVQLPIRKFLHIQWPVFAGFMAQNLSYIMAVPLLTHFSGTTISGSYASHFFLFTSLGTLSVITMEVFMARPDKSIRNYGLWMFAFTLIASLIMLGARWYYPILYGNKGFVLDGSLLWLNFLLLWVHAGRLFWINRLLFQKSFRRYGLFNILSLLLHLSAWLVFILLGKVVTPAWALTFLLGSELISVLIMLYIRQPNTAHEPIS